jgi:hypothetical protein
MTMSMSDDQLAQTEVLILQDAAGAYYVVPQAALAPWRVPAELQAAVGQALTADAVEGEGDVRGFNAGSFNPPLREPSPLGNPFLLANLVRIRERLPADTRPAFDFWVSASVGGRFDP